MGKSEKKVIVAGHICLDITPVFPEKGVNKEDNKIDKILVPGKLLQMDGVDVHTGGAAANTGLAMKILGADVRILGKRGADAFGQMIANILDRHHAGEHLIVDEGCATSYSVVLALPGNDRIFLHDPGANDTYSANDIPDDMLEGISLFHFGYPPLMKRMYESQGKELCSLFQRVSRKGIATSLDMAAIDPASQAGQADWEGILEKTLPYVDIFVPSLEELLYMMDKEKYLLLKERASGNDIETVARIKEDIRPLGERLIRSGAGIVLIKCGALGMYYRTSGAGRLKQIGGSLLDNLNGWNDREGFEASYKPEKVLSATGAGDTAVAAFLKAILDGRSLEMCMKLAAATGASTVAAYDALSGLKPFAELIEKIDSGWEKNDL